MVHRMRIGLCLTAAFILVGGVMAAEPMPHGAGARAVRPAAEPHPGPQGYQRVTEPHGWDARPATVDRGAYQHNFQAARSFKIGPYHRPAGWTAHRWGYGEILPRAYWAAPYILSLTFCRIIGCLPWRSRPPDTSGCATAAMHCWSTRAQVRSCRSSTESLPKAISALEAVAGSERRSGARCRDLAFSVRPAVRLQSRPASPLAFQP
jgi:hypothetical protein